MKNKLMLLLATIICVQYNDTSCVITPNQVLLGATAVAAGVGFLGYKRITQKSDNPEEPEKKPSTGSYCWLALGTAITFLVTRGILSYWTPEAYMLYAEGLLHLVKTGRHSGLAGKYNTDDKAYDAANDIFTGRNNLIHANATCEAMIAWAETAKEYARVAKANNLDSSSEWTQRAQVVIEDASTAQTNLKKMNNIIRKHPEFLKQQELETKERQKDEEIRLKKEELEVKREIARAQTVKANAAMINAIG
jgi:hypothetical protein